MSDDENDDRDGDNSQVPTRRSKSKPRGPGISSQRGRLRHKPKGGAGEGLKRLPEGSEARKEARDENPIKVDEGRIKLEADVQMHRIASERATAERVALIKASAKIAEIFSNGLLNWQPACRAPSASVEAS